MEMDVFPLAGLLVPDSGFFKSGGLWSAVTHALDEPDIADNGNIANDANVRLDDGDQSWSGARLPHASGSKQVSVGSVSCW